ncbi:23S rRNA (guanosine(2251)-2'-O)-methyltransferase RlmB [Nitrococcus mobilis]|uniref:23S rRNA (guanosine-2'-O-)-methyltransferase RlmB n=1 Tax=Nitrococcus mobilis Nb-231 TaxID=314278 RepID=A4BLZ9_9GAMM|nr:23S rRNA (guanosine(2251)-2'-O)-methyltransferase RlmB [Nitrococcus mobilis]EAR23337.1 RNA methyltransferase, TrmH family, group 3 [Nitrococcus mobilis Nb-231]
MTQNRIIHGLHSVRAAVRYDPTHVVEVWLDRQARSGRWQALRRQLEALACPVHLVDRRQLDRLTSGQVHQGVAIRYAGQPPRAEHELEALLSELGPDPLLLVLDQVQDPHNLGACLRTAAGAGVQAVITPRDRAVGLTPTVYKAATGAVQHIPLFQVTNLARTLRKLREAGMWLIGAAEQADVTLYEVDLSGPLVLVMGAEEAGLRRLTRACCDRLIRIPMLGAIDSLNVSVATGVVLYEVVRQRMHGFTKPPLRE